MNSITDQSCNHVVLKSSKHTRKSEKSKNSHLNLLYIYCNFSAVCNNYLVSAVFTFLDLCMNLLSDILFQQNKSSVSAKILRHSICLAHGSLLKLLKAALL